MRWLLALILLIGVAAFGGYVFLKGYPYRLYSHWVQGKDFNKYYSIQGYRESLLVPKTIAEVPPYKEDYSQLWREFPLRNASIPLPVRHPLFQTIPIIEAGSDKSPPQVGMTILNPNNREISRIYTLPLNVAEDHTQGQDLFRLPFVRNRILKFPEEKIWQDMFTFKIEVKSKSMEEMIYDLYILHLRSKFLPKATLRYGLLKDGRAVIELSSKDKDYMIELVLTNNKGNIYSYVLRTEKNNEESRKLRSKFLESIKFVPIDPSMGKILYKEFKSLNFARQVDQEGMLYLFSAWTQDMENVDMLKEMIFYLERGKNRGLQLRALYSYALKNFGKTFTSNSEFDASEDPNISLQRRIEIEAKEKVLEVSKDREKPPVEPDLTPEEKMNLYLKKAKEASQSGEKSDMTVH